MSRTLVRDTSPATVRGKGTLAKKANRRRKRAYPSVKPALTMIKFSFG